MAEEGPISLEEIIKYVEESTQSPPGQIGGGTRLETIGGWDSMGTVMFLGLVQKRTGLTIRIRDLATCPTPESFLKLVRERSDA